jgi:polyhydroxyalkanoate synthesis regulator phasin
LEAEGTAITEDIEELKKQVKEEATLETRPRWSPTQIHTYTPEEERLQLKRDRKALEAHIEAINKRLRELETEQ